MATAKRDVVDRPETHTLDQAEIPTKRSVIDVLGAFPADHKAPEVRANLASANGELLRWPEHRSQALERLIHYAIADPDPVVRERAEGELRGQGEREVRAAIMAELTKAFDSEHGSVAYRIFYRLAQLGFPVWDAPPTLWARLARIWTRVKLASARTPGSRRGITWRTILAPGPLTAFGLLLAVFFSGSTPDGSTMIALFIGAALAIGSAWLAEQLMRPIRLSVDPMASTLAESFWFALLGLSIVVVGWSVATGLLGVIDYEGHLRDGLQILLALVGALVISRIIAIGLAGQRRSPYEYVCERMLCAVVAVACFVAILYVQGPIARSNIAAALLLFLPSVASVAVVQRTIEGAASVAGPAEVVGFRGALGRAVRFARATAVYAGALGPAVVLLALLVGSQPLSGLTLARLAQEASELAQEASERNPLHDQRKRIWVPISRPVSFSPGGDDLFVITSSSSGANLTFDVYDASGEPVWGSVREASQGVFPLSSNQTYQLIVARDLASVRPAMQARPVLLSGDRALIESLARATGAEPGVLISVPLGTSIPIEVIADDASLSVEAFAKDRDVAVSVFDDTGAQIGFGDDPPQTSIPVSRGLIRLVIDDYANSTLQSIDEARPFTTEPCSDENQCVRAAVFGTESGQSPSAEEVVRISNVETVTVLEPSTESPIRFSLEKPANRFLVVEDGYEGVGLRIVNASKGGSYEVSQRSGGAASPSLLAPGEYILHFNYEPESSCDLRTARDWIGCSTEQVVEAFKQARVEHGSGGQTRPPNSVEVSVPEEFGGAGIPLLGAIDLNTLAGAWPPMEVTDRVRVPVPRDKPIIFEQISDDAVTIVANQRDEDVMIGLYTLQSDEAVVSADDPAAISARLSPRHYRLVVTACCDLRPPVVVQRVGAREAVDRVQKALARSVMLLERREVDEGGGDAARPPIELDVPVSLLQ